MPARRSRLLPWLIAYKALATPVAFGVNAIAEDRAGRVLLVRQRYSPGWHFPGGGVERGEPPARAIIRELEEEVGLRSASEPELLGLYTRTVGIATNVVALYGMHETEIAFRPNREIAEIRWVDPNAPPDDATPATLRRLAERSGKTLPTAYW